MNKLIDESNINSIKSLFLVFNTFFINYNIVYFEKSSIVFPLAILSYVMNRKDTSKMVIPEHITKTSIINTILLTHTKLLPVFNNISNANLSSISRILMLIID